MKRRYGNTLSDGMPFYFAIKMQHVRRGQYAPPPRSRDHTKEEVPTPTPLKSQMLNMADSKARQAQEQAKKIVV